MFPNSNISHLACECGKLKELGVLPIMKDYCFCSVWRVNVDSNFSKLAGRAEGRYTSILCGEIPLLDSDAFQEIAAKTAEELYELCKDYTGKNAKVLVAGLGNSEITHDSLGARVCDKLTPSENLCVFYTGVEAKNGIDTANIVRSIAQCAEAELVIAVDSLAANSEERVGRVIQLCDSGISPGSGAGNKSGEVSRGTVGVPVIAVGVPTALKQNEMSEKGYLLVKDDIFLLREKAAEIISETIRRCFEHKT